MSPSVSVLPGGLRVCVESVPQYGRGLAAVALTVAAGGDDDPAGRHGTAHLVEHLMFPRSGGGSADPTGEGYAALVAGAVRGAGRGRGRGLQRRDAPGPHGLPHHGPRRFAARRPFLGGPPPARLRAHGGRDPHGDRRHRRGDPRSGGRRPLLGIGAGCAVPGQQGQLRYGGGAGGHHGR
ncbi:insulinase family protein [Streptomyces sp. MBT98]|nr:insulinase family protein [Streptomyces sp. MBT98]